MFFNEEPLSFCTFKRWGEVTPSVIKKHLKLIYENSGRLCIFVQKNISSYNRKRLINFQIPFIIPGYQMYLPHIGINLREHFAIEKKSKDYLSPATQTIIINALLQSCGGEPLSPSNYSNILGYSLMTVSRAYDELEEKKLGNIYRKGKERLLIFEEEKSELWKKTEPLMRSPIKKKILTRGKKPKIFAGLSALANETLLALPSIETYAMSFNNWKKSEYESLEEGVFELEIWHYDPAIFVKKRSVGPFSLFLSLENSGDERIELALNEMMERIKW